MTSAGRWAPRPGSSAVVLAAMVACGGGDPATPTADGAVDGPVTIDAAPGPDAAWQPDGPPTRQACTDRLGTALTSVHGRLDGYLVAIVPTTTRTCNGDATHVHLQVRTNGAIYDVAVNVSDPANVDYLARDLPMPDGPWQEGWHPGQGGLFDYVALGLHSPDFTPMPEAQLTAALATELATANHVSVFMTGYGPDGGHLVHRNRGADGAIVLRPLGAARALMFRFSTNTF